MTKGSYRCGFVAVVGRPNVGKSTLINALVGHKVSIVTAKPQTTRHRILAVHTTNESQIVFIDTPGMHRSVGKAMNRIMNRTASNALTEADLALFVIEADRWSDEDEDVLNRIRQSDVAAIALLNKIDTVRPKEALLSALASLAKQHEFVELIPISAKNGENLSTLLDIIPAYLPVSPPLFPQDMRTDRNREFHIAEVIREKLTLVLHQELPYGLTVQVERYQEESSGISVDAVIWVERESQKGIVVGKGGKLLKQVGRSARLELKDRVGCPIHLEMWVKVKQNWADNDKDLQILGFDPP